MLIKCPLLMLQTHNKKQTIRNLKKTLQRRYRKRSNICQTTPQRNQPLYDQLIKIPIHHPLKPHIQWLNLHHIRLIRRCLLPTDLKTRIRYPNKRPLENQPPWNHPQHKKTILTLPLTPLLRIQNKKNLPRSLQYHNRSL
jgi:hypothetical protein